MFFIIAIIRATSIESVRKQLESIGVQAMTISECAGHGRQKGRKEIYRGHEYHIALVPKVKIEVACTQGALQLAIDAIQHGAKSAGEGRIGDGKIFVLGLEDCVRIRTGESGKNAI
jgi:nitrogen regulatory protein P-II 2